jgi:hypothetical protein
VTPNDNQRILYRTVCSLNLAKNYDEAAKQMLVLKALGRGIQNGLDSALIARQLAVTATGVKINEELRAKRSSNR